MLYCYGSDAKKRVQAKPKVLRIKGLVLNVKAPRQAQQFIELSIRMGLWMNAWMKNGIRMV